MFLYDAILLNIDLDQPAKSCVRGYAAQKRKRRTLGKIEVEAPLH